MRVRRVTPALDLRSLPLDSCDMLMCSHTEDAVALVDLAEASPCTLPEAMDRVRNMVELGVLELLVEDDEEQDAPRFSALRLTEVANDAVAPQAVAREKTPPTGVRLRPDVDTHAGQRALIGAIVLERKRALGAIEQPGNLTPRKKVIPLE